MSVSVVIPAAGGTTRPPVWLLERPDGRLIIEVIIQQLDLTEASRVLVVVLQSHVDEFCGGNVAAVQDHILASIRATDSLPPTCALKIVCMPTPSKSAADTVRYAVDTERIDGPIFVKDCDGAFRHKVTGENVVVGLKLTSANSERLHDLPSKSYVEDCGGVLTNVCEKQIVSDTICVGGYGFSSAATFVAALAEVERTAIATAGAGGPSGRIFTSHIVLHLLLNAAEVFRVALVDELEDWKNEAGWKRNARTYRNYAVALEGVLVTPKPAAFALRMANNPLSECYDAVAANIDAVRAVHAKGHSRVIVMSSQPECRRAAVDELLRALNVPCDALVLGMLAGGTTLIGPFDNRLVACNTLGEAATASLGDML